MRPYYILLADYMSVFLDTFNIFFYVLTIQFYYWVIRKICYNIIFSIIKIWWKFCQIDKHVKIITFYEFIIFVIYIFIIF